MEEVCEGKDFVFAAEEEKVLRLWEALDAFHTQLKLREGRPEYIFYDGPPFATGLPHYGHILAGTIKDIVTRYQSANGYHVTRRFGWDCHGLPVEHEIDQKLGIKSRSQVLEMGIRAYNEECRSIVMRYSQEWQKIVTRVGRWIDFHNDYKTLDPPYMESVWWVFQQLHHKGLVYRGLKVMPYSTGCYTVLSNFEAGLNYKDVSDPAVMVSFPLKDDPDGAGLVAWTTTPWTLPSNLALCVNPTLDYVKVRHRVTGEVYIVLESRLSQLPTKRAKDASNVVPKGKAQATKGGGNKQEKSSEQDTKLADSSNYEVLDRFKGVTLAGRKYEPLFSYFKEYLNVAFRIVTDDYVTEESGTGVVHIAPAFGEDDYRISLSAGIIQKRGDIPNPVDADGCFTEPVSDLKGQYVKDADKDIIAKLKSMGRLISAGSIMHSYPFCWRSETPLIYKAIPSWFVAVENFKDRLLENNKKTYWVPEYVKEKRFHNWLENARDWAVSRTRFWGTPLPIWLSDDGVEMVVVGSIKELEELSGCKVNDLHRHNIDHITIPSKRGPEFGVLQRVEDVFDCWFESGSMPYAYIHYPFENKELFDRNFPGHFVAEGLDQTRGWFYTLMVLSTALFDKPAFKNLVCNGLVLAEDGKKMSKRLKNYPAPMEVIDEYGADALRLYLINSPVVRAEPLRFKKEGVFAVVKDVFLPWYNAYRFLVQNAIRLEVEGSSPFVPLSSDVLRYSNNVLDQWINSATQTLVSFVRKEMQAYRLYTVVPFLLKFIDNLTNIYVRFNRKRLKGRNGDKDCRVSLSTLYNVLLTTCKAMAPFTPFFTEALYQNLRKSLPPSADASIHFCLFPEVNGDVDSQIEKSIYRMMSVIDLARNVRERHNKPLKVPIKEMVVVHPDDDFLDDITGKLKVYVQEELNVRNITCCNDPLKYAALRAEPDFSILGKRLGQAMRSIAKDVKNMTQTDILNFEQSGEVFFSGHRLTIGDIKVIREFKAPDGINRDEIDAAGDGDVLVILDLRSDETLLDVGVAREIVNRIQKLRKRACLEPIDNVDLYFELLAGSDGRKSSVLERVMKSEAQYFCDCLGSPLLPSNLLPQHAVAIISEKYSGIAEGCFKITLTKPSLVFNEEVLIETCLGDADHAENVKVYLISRNPAVLKSEMLEGKMLKVSIEGQPDVKIVHGDHFYFSVSEYYLSKAC